MNYRPRPWLGALAVLLLGLLGALLLSRLQPYEQNVDHGPSAEAKANPYLAAEQFLRQRGMPVRRADSLESLAELPAEGQTLLLLGDRQGMSPRQADRLLQWAARGGHLLFVAERLYDEQHKRSGDLLLDRLQIRQMLTADLDDEASQDDAQDDAYPRLTKLYLENEDAPAYIDFDPDYHLYDAADRAQAWANDARATHMLQLQHGQGLITVLTDAWIWRNDRIGDYDNAWLLWYLTQDSAVTLLYRADHPSLATQLGRHFPQALVALALLTALALWHFAARQGPLLTAPPRGRRQLEEHLRASAAFDLRHGGQRRLLQRLQHDIQRRARRRHPGFERLPVAEQWQTLGRLARLPTAAVGRAMRPVAAKPLSAADFTRQVAHLQTLRNAL